MFSVFRLNFVFYIFLELVYAFPPYVLDEWSPCITGDGLKGFCIDINYCPSAVTDLNENKVLPDICDFNHDNTPIVCCVKLRKSINECMMIRENRNFQPFIIGGSPARKGEFKHMAHIGYLQKDEPEHRISFRCGASLISNRFLLTAAHCQQSHTKIAVAVKLGTIKGLTPKQSELYKEGEIIKIKNFLPHPNYKLYGTYYDIALILLEKNVKFTEFIQPACLYIKHEVNRPLKATGWGLTSNSRKSQSSHLLQLPLIPLPNERCDNLVPNLYHSEPLQSNIMCLRGEVNYTDTCKGDSGGPVQIRERLDQNVHSIVAVTSIGNDPCSGTGLYVRVAAVVDWIEENVWT